MVEVLASVCIHLVDVAVYDASVVRLASRTQVARQSLRLGNQRGAGVSELTRSCSLN